MRPANDYPFGTNIIISHKTWRHNHHTRIKQTLKYKKQTNKQTNKQNKTKQNKQTNKNKTKQNKTI